jgi:class 3 adenylate cyclase
VFDNDGVVVDIMGDGVLAAFGLVGRSEKHRDMALRTAHIACTDVVQSMRVWLEDQNWGHLVADHRKKYGEPTGTDDFDVRVGLDSGEVAIGLTGSEGGLEFSVIAEPTIIAARLQAETKELKVTLCASDRVFSEGVSPETLQLVPAKPWGKPIQLRGQTGIETYVYTWTRDDARYGLVSREAKPG